MSSTYVATYEYNGVASLVGTEYPESELLYTRYNTSGSFDRIDRFNRVTSDIWTRGINDDADAAYDVYRDYYDTDITWSRSSNIDLVEDNVYPGWDVAYTNDGLERLGQAKRGTWGGSSITSPLHDEQWTLSQTGNWEVYKLDLNGDTDFTDTDELNDDQTFNVVNELTVRDTDDNGTDNYTLVYDAAGNMTDDGKDYEFLYDAFGRLVEVQNQSQQTVAEYSYNGLGYRTGWHSDVDGDGTVEANTVSNTEDPWFQFVYDTGWRVTATYRASHYSTWTIDANPKEQFVNHAAGLAGSGGSSYIDSVILRDRDANTNWEAQADGTLEERTYTCQNWRADVVALMTSAGVLVNQVRYDPYGKPFGIAKTDLEADGDVDSPDYLKWLAYYSAGTMPFADWNWDGSADSTDNTAYAADRSADTGIGRGALGYAYSHANGASRKGYAGYEVDPVLTGSEGWESIYHVRNRVYLSQLGRWTRRDPLGYSGSIASTYLYAHIAPILGADIDGLLFDVCFGNADGRCDGPCDWIIAGTDGGGTQGSGTGCAGGGCSGERRTDEGDESKQNDYCGRGDPPSYEDFLPCFAKCEAEYFGDESAISFCKTGCIIACTPDRQCEPCERMCAGTPNPPACRKGCQSRREWSNTNCSARQLSCYLDCARGYRSCGTKGTLITGGAGAAVGLCGGIGGAIAGGIVGTGGGWFGSNVVCRDKQRRCEKWCDCKATDCSGEDPCTTCTLGPPPPWDPTF